MSRYEGSQLKRMNARSAYFLCSSLGNTHHLPEIPIPLNKRLLLRARNFIFFESLPCFLHDYPSPHSFLKNKIYDEEIIEENGCFGSSLDPAPFSPFPPNNIWRWCDT